MNGARPGGRQLLAALLVILAVAALVAGIATGNWLTAVAMVFTVTSVAVSWRESRKRDREHRAAFEERLERARRPRDPDQRPGSSS